MGLVFFLAASFLFLTVPVGFWNFPPTPFRWFAWTVWVDGLGLVVRDTVGMRVSDLSCRVPWVHRTDARVS